MTKKNIDKKNWQLNVGVELEIGVNANFTGHLQVGGYHSGWVVPNTNSTWCIQSDGSLRSHMRTMEITFNGYSTNIEDIRTRFALLAMAIWNKPSATIRLGSDYDINDSMGMHMHFSLTNKARAKVKIMPMRFLTADNLALLRRLIRLKVPSSERPLFVAQYYRGYAKRLSDNEDRDITNEEWFRREVEGDNFRSYEFYRSQRLPTIEWRSMNARGCTSLDAICNRVIAAYESMQGLIYKELGKDCSFAYSSFLPLEVCKEENTVHKGTVSIDLGRTPIVYKGSVQLDSGRSLFCDDITIMPTHDKYEFSVAGTRARKRKFSVTIDKPQNSREEINV